MMLYNVSCERIVGAFKQSEPTSSVVETKAPYFTLLVQTDTNAVDWTNIWVEVEVYVYLRNE